MAGLARGLMRFALLYQDSGKLEEETFRPLVHDSLEDRLHKLSAASGAARFDEKPRISSTKRTMNIAEFAQETLQNAGVFIYLGHGKAEPGSAFPRIDPDMNKTSYTGQNFPVEKLMQDAKNGSLLIIHSCNANSDEVVLAPPSVRTGNSSAVVYQQGGFAASVSNEAPLLDKFLEYMEVEGGMDKFEAIEAAIKDLKETPVYAADKTEDGKAKHDWAIHYFET